MSVRFTVTHVTVDPGVLTQPDGSSLTRVDTDTAEQAINLANRLNQIAGRQVATSHVPCSFDPVHEYGTSDACPACPTTGYKGD